jgi:hypothetical protein
MAKYARKAQVLFTEQQYRDLLEVAQQEGRPLGALLREAAEQVLLRRKRGREKTQAVKDLLSLAPTAVPRDYQTWERQYLDAKHPRHG